MKHDISTSCIAELMEEKKIRNNVPVQESVKSLTALADEFKNSDLFQDQSPEIEIIANYTKYCAMNDQQIKFIYINTKKQANSKLWHEQ